MQPQPGDKVRLKSNPSRQGVMTNEYDGSERRRKVLVDFGGGDEEFVLLNSLEKIEMGLIKPYEEIKKGRYGRASDLRGNITFYRLSGKLANLIYSLNTTNTQFFPYQFKPVLQLLDSPCRGLLIADEVGLGKTIEAGLIWTELRARDDAKRLLVLCPAMLREKWQDELRIRFGIEADICDARELLRVLKKNEEGRQGSFALIASQQGLRPPKKWDQETSKERNTAKLARYFESKEYDDPLFDMVVVDEAHYLRNPHTQTYKLGQLLRPVTDNLLLLSATPIQLRSDDLFYLLNLLDEDAFPYPYSFGKNLEANAPIINLRDRLLREKISKDDFIKGLKESLGERIFNDNSQLKYLLDNPPSDAELQSSQGRSLYAERLDRINPLSKVITRTRKRDVQEMRVVRIPHAVMAEMAPVERAFYDIVTNEVREFCADQDIGTGFLLTIPQRQMTSCMAASCRAWLERINAFIDPNEVGQTVYEAFGDTEDQSPAKEEELGVLLGLLTRITDEFSDYSQLRESDTKYKKLKESLFGYWKENPSGKIVLFSFYRETLRYLKERLKEDGVDSVVVQGGMDKYAAIKEFASLNGPNILLSSEVAAEGVDLQFSSLLINYDLPWNPMRIEQRIGRIDRIGQEAECILIWNFLYSDSIDERIYNRLLKRLNTFERALGGMEAILGEQIRTMGYELLVHKLSPEQENDRIEQTAIAMETLNRSNQRLEEDATQLIAHGDYIQNQVKAAKEIGRYVTSEDLYTYVKDFLIETYEGTRLIRKSNEKFIFELELSIEGKLDFSNFVESSQLTGKTRIHTTRNARILFENNVGTSSFREEVISQHHPLVRFVSRKLKDKGKTGGYNQVTASRVHRDLLPNMEPGTYVYGVSRWSVTGARVIERLSYVARNIENGDWLDSLRAESLVNTAAMFGKDWLEANNLLNHVEVAEEYDECLEQLEEGFKLFEGDLNRENNDRIAMMINSLENHRDKQRVKLEETIYNFRISGEKKKLSMIPATEGKISNLVRKIDEKIALLKNKQVIESNENSVSGGVIQVY